MTALSSVTIAEAVRSGRQSATAVVAEHLDRVEARNTSLNALALLFPDEAMRVAESIDRRRSNGDPLGPLAGVPVSVKANIDVAGKATTHGIPALQNAIAPRDAPIIARLKAADAIIIGHANMPDMAMRLHSSSTLYGATQNVFDASLTPGGSSGGDAVAVAAGMAALGVGNDAGGSLRVPAAFAGICALKPTTGRFASDRAIGRDLSFASQVIPVDGFLARSVEDLAVAFEVASGADIQDPRSVPVPSSHRRRPRMRIGVIDDPGGIGVDPATQAAMARAMGRLHRAGYHLVPVDVPDLEATLAAYEGLVMTEFSQDWANIERLIGVGVRQYLAHAMALSPPLPLAEYIRATAERMRLQRLWLELLEPLDAVIAPVFCARIPTVDADIASLESHAECAKALRMCKVTNLAGLPATSISSIAQDDLPVGIQVIGGPFEEGTTLAIARHLVDEEANFLASPA